MRIKKSSIILIVCILTIICFCYFIKNTIATEENISLYEKLMNSSTVEEMYSILLSNQSIANELTIDEIKILQSHAEEIYLANGDSTNEYEDLTETLAYLAGELETENIETMADLTTGTYNWTTGTQGAITIPTGNTVVINLSGTITLTGTIIIAKDSTLTINGTGTFIRGSGFEDRLFDIYSTGNLIIEGKSSTNRIIIDGNSALNQTAEATLIRSDNNLTLRNVTLQNNHTDRYRDEEDEEDLSSNSEDTFAGGAITILNHDNIVIIDNCIIKNCKAVNGGAIYFCRLGYGDISITNTTISNCESTSTDKGGGAIFIDGKLKTGETVENENIANYTINMSNVTINSCKARAGSAMYIHNKGISKITMYDCIIKKCEARSGGGAIKTDGNSNYQLTISGGQICENISDGFGGGIYWNAAGTYSNLIIKDNVQIFNNIAATQGGGFFVEGKNIDIQSANIYNNKAANGGAIGIKTFANDSYKDGDWKSTDSFNLALGEDVTLSSNMATESGGGICFNIVDGVPEDGFTFNYTNAGAILENNIVSSDGGTTIDGIGGGIVIIDATSINTYNVNIIIESGTIKNNYASEGGAVYSAIGDFTITGGTIEGHNVSGNGGAIYVSGGTFTMTGGEIKNNTALNGAGAYVVGGNFLMTSGNITCNTANNEGGAVYVNGGSIIIGVQGCTDENNKHQSPNTHPNVTDNYAVYGGGGFMTKGTLTMYCGVLRGNTSNNEGTGNNIYMNGGTLNLDGGTIGEETNPGVVLVGGQLNDTREDDEIQGEEIIMIYHSGLENTANHETSVTLGKYVNLPAAQEGWSKSGYTMVGWSTIENAEVKAFDDYKSVGMAVKVDDSNVDGEIHYYAVWAKTSSAITYDLAGGTLDGTNANSYNYIVTSKNIHLTSPEKQYYTFIGWRLTASKDTITNWETYYPENENSVFYEVENPDSGLDLNIGTHFGDITLTAIYEENISDIEIIVDNSIAKNQKYVFEVTGKPSIGGEMTPLKVVVICDEEGYGSTTVKGLLVGKYTVSLQNDWNWRYKLSDENINSTTNVDIDESQDKHTLTFQDFSIKNSFWLNAYNLFIKNSN